MKGLDNRVGEIKEVRDIKPGEVKDVQTGSEDRDAEGDDDEEESWNLKEGGRLNEYKRAWFVCLR